MKLRPRFWAQIHGHWSWRGRATLPLPKKFHEICSLFLRSYSEQNSLFFTDVSGGESLLVSFLRVKNSKKKIARIGCPETSVKNYHSIVRKIPKYRRSLLHRGGRLKSCLTVPCLLDRTMDSLRMLNVPRFLFGVRHLRGCILKCAEILKS
jgi:hypothetical protein